jgi:hypothetical protein
MIHLFVHRFILLVLWIFARSQKTACLQKKMPKGVHSFPIFSCATVFEFAVTALSCGYSGYLRFFAQIFAQTSD